MHTPSFLWAKKHGTGDGEVWHPLLYHMIDVGVVAEELWHHALHHSIRRFFVTELALSEQEAIAWVCFLAALHDTGKASPAFQRQSDKAVRLLREKGFRFALHALRCPHGIITADVLADLLQSFCTPANFPRDLGKTIALTVGGHHGVFDSGKSKPGQRGEQLWRDVRQDIVITLAQLFGVPRPVIPHSSANAALYILLAGLTCAADWIGSDERYFPYAPDEPDPARYMTIARQRAANAVQSLGWSGWHPPTSSTTFNELFPFVANPRPLQTEAVALAPHLNGSSSLVIIEAPMGEGKTEAAMFLADYWAATQQQQGCYFALPTQATSNQMFGRVNRFLKERYPDLRVNTQLVHGATLLSQEFAELRLATYPEDEEGNANKCSGVVAEEWFLPKKRSLLAPFGVGTIDQALLAVLQTKHFFVRLFGLAHKTVIVDEVHAYDTYMSTLLERLLEWLHALGCSVILLSATLPARKRQVLFRAFGGNELRQDATYPRLTWISGNENGAASFPAAQQKRITVRHVSDDVTELARALREAVVEGGCVAVVCNTVGRAQEIYQILKQEQLVPAECLQLLHGRFPFDEREKRERFALSSFGKEEQSERPPVAILVATQIIEQSLDLDFDLMVTDLAPADLVLQRVGRLHRHDNQRPVPLASPTLWLRMPPVDDHQIPDFGPSAKIYDRYTLLRSYLALKDRSSIELPEDLEMIVETVYGDQLSWPSPAWQEAAITAEEEFEQEIEKGKYKARTNLIASPRSPESPGEFLQHFSRQLEEDNPEVHQALQALTRLAEPSVQVVCLLQTPEGLRCQSDGMVISLKGKPTAETIRVLLRRSLTITDKRVVFTLLENEQFKPRAWKENAALRHHRMLVFENGETAVGRYTLRLNPDLGLVITATETGGSDE